MLTGLYPHSHGLTENDGRFGGRAEFDENEQMIQREFAAAGYSCGWFGKWHLSQKLSALDFGFEGFSLLGYGYPYGTRGYRTYLARFHDGPLWAKIESSGESRCAPGEMVDMTAELGWYDYEAGTAILHGPEEVHEAYFLAARAATWLDGLHGEVPFFLRVDAWGPHPPYTIPSGFASPLVEADVPLAGNLFHDLSTRPKHHADYRDQWHEDLRVDAFDWPLLSRRAMEHCILVERALVRLIDHLDEVGKPDDTIVVFCADHGDAVASNGGVMNKGSLMVEETMRIPLFTAGSGTAAGKVSNALIGNVDLAPTLLDLCGLLPCGWMQGYSARHHLADPHEIAFRQQLIVEHYGLHELIIQRGLYSENWKYVIQPDGFEELYDLATDPCEVSNLTRASHHRAQLVRCRQALHEKQRSLGDTDPRLGRMQQVLSALDQ